ncbi:MAG TPA: flagellar biosynthesis protein FliO [Xanthobacteraceae bacterium]|jgi:hypothetical protein
MDFLFGEEQYGLRILLAFLVVATLIGFFGWLVRRFGSERLGAASARGRQPRLAVIDAATVDGRRRLILIRRDNIEHLLMIGGPTDLVVEPNIVRATAARELAPSRSTPADAMPRAATPSAEPIWPSQLEPAPAASPPPRPQRQPTLTEETPSRRVDVEPPATRQTRPADSLAGLAAELYRQPPPPIAPRPPRERETAQEPPFPSRVPPQAPAVDASFTAPTADAAHRFEAALRRGPKPGAAAELKSVAAPEPKPTKPVQATVAAPAIDSEPQPEPAVERESALNPVVAPETRAAHSEAKPNRESKPPAPKASVYDSLEQEMANLLGRPNKT